jgi:hypothetical protein
MLKQIFENRRKRMVTLSIELITRMVALGPSGHKVRLEMPPLERSRRLLPILQNLKPESKRKVVLHPLRAGVRKIVNCVQNIPLALPQLTIPISASSVTLMDRRELVVLTRENEA